MVAGWRWACSEFLINTALRLIVWLQRDSPLLAHARREIRLAKLDAPESAYDGMLADAVIQLVAVFSAQGHSGMSAGLVRQLVSKAFDWKPLTDLTGDEDGWIDGSIWSPGKYSKSPLFERLP